MAEAQLSACMVQSQIPNCMVGPHLRNTMVGPQLLNIMVGPQLLNIMVGPQLLNIMVGPQLLNIMVGPQLRNTMVGPQLLNTMVGTQLNLFQNLPNSQPISSRHDVIHTPAPFPVWGLLWQWWLSYPLRTSVNCTQCYAHELLTRIVQSQTKLNDKI